MPDNDETPTDEPVDDIPAHHRLAPPARDEEGIRQHLMSLATPSPALVGDRLYSPSTPIETPELQTLRLRRERRREALTAEAKLAEDSRLGETPAVPRIVQDPHLPTRAPAKADPFDDDFFRRT